MKPQPIRWTIEAASREFGRSRTTVSSRLTASAAKPAADGTYSTQQITAALFGDMQSARLREANARADLAEARTQIIHKSWLPLGLVSSNLSALVVLLRQRLLAVPTAVGSKYDPSSGSASLIELCRAEIAEACEDLSKAELPENFGQAEIDKEDEAAEK